MISPGLYCLLMFHTYVKLCLVGSDWHWQSIDDTVVCPVSPVKDIRKELIEKYDLCLTGEVRIFYI